MAEAKTFEMRIADLAATDSRRRPDAYFLICETIGFALERLGERRHLSAAELVDALLDYARREYGPLAPEVLAEFGLHGAADVGEVVYRLIGAGLLAASDRDAPEDFPRIAEWFRPEAPAPEARRERPLPKID